MPKEKLAGKQVRVAVEARVGRAIREAVKARRANGEMAVDAHIIRRAVRDWMDAHPPARGLAPEATEPRTEVFYGRLSDEVRDALDGRVRALEKATERYVSISDVVRSALIGYLNVKLKAGGEAA